MTHTRMSRHEVMFRLRHVNLESMAVRAREAARRIKEDVSNLMVGKPVTYYSRYGDQIALEPLEFLTFYEDPNKFFNKVIIFPTEEERCVALAVIVIKSFGHLYRAELVDLEYYTGKPILSSIASLEDLPRSTIKLPKEIVDFVAPLVHAAIRYARCNRYGVVKIEPMGE